MSHPLNNLWIVSEPKVLRESYFLECKNEILSLYGNIYFQDMVVFDLVTKINVIELHCPFNMRK